ncbi:hypothetical protein Patl1_00699 [Pistacia atlantica]|uniref:Uncharacterized protein n=1 Tax=Pistacia atlantica TaxID=434234 RepID=A0ACC1CC24_9ROSI|nr:hypothetical protein Patl1_00699 [Pistacia atlantica]
MGSSAIRYDEEKEESFAYAIQLATGSVLPMTLKAAIDLDIFEIIAKAGPGAKLSASEIASQMSAQSKDAPMMVDRILRLLSSHSVLTCYVVGLERLYGLAPVSKAQLKDAVLEGGVPFDRVHGTHAFEYPGLDARFNEVFNSIEHVGGDMFESVPKGDAIFMKWILHDWSDEHCLKLLKNCYKSIPEDGKVIVVEGILPVMADTKVTSKAISQTDVVMMTQNPGGKERTKHEFMALGTEAGFSGITYECFVFNFWVMEFYK